MPSIRRHRRPALMATLLVLGLMAALMLGCWPEPTAAPVPSPTPTLAGPAFLLKPAAEAIRILCYNVNWDAIFPEADPRNSALRTADRVEPFRRILRATQPDIVCLQEIGGRHGPQDVADILDQVLPLEGGGKWQGHQGRDNVIVSRFPLRMLADQSVHQGPALPNGHAMALVDLPDDLYGVDLYLINAHFKSGAGADNIALRERHADALMAWIRDLKAPGGQITLPFGTPFMIVGDLNVYDTDPARQLHTLISGEILDQAQYGPSFQPDWDNTPLTDVLPRHNASGAATWTWRDDGQRYNPGALDRIIYSDSVLEVVHAFVLNTTIMTPQELVSSGLEWGDVLLTPKAGDYDHLPIVVDVLPITP